MFNIDFHSNIIESRYTNGFFQQLFSRILGLETASFHKTFLLIYYYKKVTNNNITMIKHSANKV